jgi:hypothetical protein
MLYPRMNEKPTSAATYERARRLANVQMWTIALQCRRLRSSEPEDKEFKLRKWADFDMLVVALTRLRRIAKLASSVPDIRASMNQAIQEFDSAIPHIKRFRDVAEHVDEYAVDSGRSRSVSRKDFETSTLSTRGPTLHWLGHMLNATTAYKASLKLFSAIQKASSAFPRYRPPSGFFLQRRTVEGASPDDV